ncbi:MAG TPA: hypothetical protein VD931_11230 [Baekduia sp.]|nr:hypothetical protein [Baekduia sp.]
MIARTFALAVAATVSVVPTAGAQAPPSSHAIAVRTPSPFASCGGFTTSATAFRTPVGAERQADPAARALAAWLPGARTGDRLFPEQGWRRLADTPQYVAFQHRAVHGPAWLAVARPRTDGSWMVTEGLPCSLRRAPPGLVAERFSIRGPLNPRSRRITVATLAASCEGPAAAGARFVRAEARYRRGQVVLLLLTRPRPAGSSGPSDGVCPSVALPVQRTIVLPRPLASRTVWNDATFPPDRVPVFAP